VIYLYTEGATVAPPAGGDFAVLLRNNGADAFDVALQALPAFNVALRDNGVAAFDVAFRPSTGLAVDFTATASFSVEQLGPTTGMSVAFTATASFSAGVTGGSSTAFTPVFVGTVSVGQGPIDVASDGTDLWVACYGDATVHRVSLASRTVIAVLQMPEASGPCAVVFDGEAVWVALALAKRVAKINRTTNEVVTLAPLESYPRLGIYDGTDLWFTQQAATPEGGFAVTVFNPTPGGGESGAENLAVTGADPNPLPS
jgi:hypothetical protein